VPSPEVVPGERVVPDDMHRLHDHRP
jgi:hypothetical protein